LVERLVWDQEVASSNLVAPIEQKQFAECYLACLPVWGSGPHGSETIKLECDPLIAEWLAHGRQSPHPVQTQTAVSINKLILAFWQNAENYCRRPDGTHTSEVSNLRQVWAFIQLKFLIGARRRVGEAEWCDGSSTTKKLAA
jgi:hypothetical protein